MKTRRALATALLLAAASLLPAFASALPGAGLPLRNAVPPAPAAPPASLPAAGQAAAVPGVDEMQFVCPRGSSQDIQNTDPSDRTVLGCPIRVYDTEHYFGNPALAVNPIDPRQVAFFSLHGSPTDDGPHGYSRESDDAAVTGGPHVTFTSGNQGLSWSDQPIPDGPQAGLTAESAAGAMDSQGNLYAGYLWTVPSGNATRYGGVIGLYKAGTAEDPRSMARAYGEGQVIESRTERNPITALSLVDVPSAKPLPMVNLTTNETVEPVPPGTDGELADDDAGDPDERVAAVWHEAAADPMNSTTRMSGWIEAAFTGTDAASAWTRMAPGQLIGPCKAASNAAAHDGLVYVACVVEAGYKHRRGARVGDIDVWRIDPLTGDASLAGASPLRGGRPLLAMNPDGYMVLATLSDPQPSGATVNVAFGWRGRQWTNSFGMGATLHALASPGGAALEDASLNALAINDADKTAFLVYKERLPPTQRQPIPQIDPLNPPDPARLAEVRLTEYQKVLVSFNPCDGIIAAKAFTLGTGIDAYQLEAYAQEPATFNDIQDGLQWVRDPVGGGEMLYFAVNDYGAMQFGGVALETASSPCPVAPPVPEPPVPPLPQALSIASPASLAAGATIGAAALAMVSYLLLAKRKTTRTAAVKQK